MQNSREVSDDGWGQLRGSVCCGTVPAFKLPQALSGQFFYPSTTLHMRKQINKQNLYKQTNKKEKGMVGGVSEVWIFWWMSWKCYEWQESVMNVMGGVRSELWIVNCEWIVGLSVSDSKLWSPTQCLGPESQTESWLDLIWIKNRELFHRRLPREGKTKPGGAICRQIKLSNNKRDKVHHLW